MGKTLCIILHYGSEDDTFSCLDSLMHEESVETIVSDNDPSQGFVLPERFSGSVEVFRTGGSSGFAHGNNVTASRFLNTTHDSLLILNNDTVIKNGAVSRLRETLSLPNVGAVGPCMPYASAPEKIWACGGYINRVNLRIGGVTKGFSKEPFDVGYLPGAAIMCRADVWRALNGLPEHYFLAYEEAEFALEIKRLGLRVLADPSAIILHKVGMSSQSRPEYFYNSVRNRITFAKYLYGSYFGFLVGFAVTLTGISAVSYQVARLRSSLWSQAVADDFRKVRVDRQKLIDIADQYRGRV